MSDKTFAQHIEDGLKSLGTSMLERQKNTKQWDDESKALGLIKTADKSRLLEAEAYRKTRVGKDINQDLQLLEYLLKAQKYQNQLADLNARTFENILAFLLRGVIFSSFFASLWFGLLKPTNNNCLVNKVKSDYCQIVREKVYFFTGDIYKN
jgi:hypothetical protein